MKNISFRLKKIALAVAFMTGTAGVAWASCGGTEAMVATSAGSLASKVVSKIVSVTAEIIALDNLQTQMLISSLRVATKQVESSGEKVANATVQAEQANAALNKEMSDKEIIDKVVMDYTSQGFDPCGISTKTTKIAKAETDTNASIKTRMQTEIHAVGRYADVATSIKSREELHQDLFCTQAEVTAGSCSKLGKIPGGDSNASLIFSTDTSEEAIQAKNAVINNIIGLPDAPIPAAAANTPEAAAYVLEKKQKDAFMTFAAYSLKTIQTENEQFKQVMDDRIGDYFGTDRATAWAKSQASQASRGLLVDLVKIQGLNLKVAERRLRQGLRTEANLAALVELENKANNSGATRGAEDIAIRESTRKKVN